MTGLRNAAVVAPEEPHLREEAIGFLKAFAMPTSILIEGLMGSDQRLLGSCRRLGVGHMSTELAGPAPSPRMLSGPLSAACRACCGMSAC